MYIVCELFLSKLTIFNGVAYIITLSRFGSFVSFIHFWPSVPLTPLYTDVEMLYLIGTVHNVQFVKYDVTVSFMAQVLDTVTYLVPQVLDTAS